ncbi:MAG TPA: FAD-dependent oxidoreductase, partial [Chloroflexia bacterium]|nr:FAD-dependent oxidoreductase [Chloroflexia bacterium]
MHIGVLGGGALGLTAAMRLARRGAKVTIIEKEHELGGLAAGFPVGDKGTYLEKFYHHLFRTDKDIVALIDELGLTDKLGWHNVNTSTLIGGKKWKVTPKDLLLTYRVMSFPSRLRMAAASAYLKFEGNYRRLRNQTAAEWIRKWMGKEAYEVQWKPLLYGKFGDHYDKIALPWFWSRVHERSFSLGYLRGGFQQLYERLGEEVRKSGGEILTGTAVTKITPIEGGKTRIDTDNHGTFEFDAVVSTLPTKLFLRLAEGLPDSYREKYDWGTALGAHVIILELSKSLLGDVYWLNINDTGYPFLVADEHTNMMPKEDYAGNVLVYLGNYLPMDHRYFKQPDEQTLAEFLPHLKKLNPDFDESWITNRWFLKAPFAQPVVTREYEEHIPPLKTPLPNVYMGNMFQVYPQDRGQNYSMRLGNRLASLIKWPEESGAHPEAVAGK